MIINYPTKHTILSSPVTFRKGAIRILQTWYKANKKHTYNQNKQLLHNLAKFYKTSISVFNTPTKNGDCYIPKQKMICLSGDSLITALHEFAHHLYGPSETTACRWSIWLFKKAFPESYNKLTFKRHMLVRKQFYAKKTHSCQYDDTPTTTG
jgi:hypothetical protein